LRRVGRQSRTGLIFEICEQTDGHTDTLIAVLCITMQWQINQLYPFSHFDRTLAYDRQMADRHTDIAYTTLA